MTKYEEEQDALSTLIVVQAVIESKKLTNTMKVKALTELLAKS